MKKLILILTAAMIVAPLLQAQEINTDLKPFRKVVASPRINLILRKGNQENIRLVYHRVTPDKINIKQHGKTLHIYLDDAKVAEKTVRTDYATRKRIYDDVDITAYVTYRTLEELEIRGNQELSCLDPISSESFTLKAYGENEITLASLRTGYLHTKLYGENNLKIKNGKAEFQKYSLYGENDIDARSLRSYSATANIFGESKLKLSTEDELKINSFGEGKVMYGGNAQLNKRIIIGNTQISRLE
jgi:Putative auto-transporter adhesin, head GIN domain